MKPLSLRLVAAVVASVGAVAIGSSGCIAHVVIEPPPPPTAPVEMRETYFEEHEAAPTSRGDLEARSRFGAAHATFVPKSVRLKNGTKVSYVEDLKPLVDDKSEAGRAIDASLAFRDRADLITMGGAVVGAVGIAAGGVMLGTYLTQNGLNDPKSYGADPLTIGALGALVVGGVGGGAIVAWGMTVRDEEDDARAHAFKSLDSSLRDKLALPDTVSTAPKKANDSPSTNASTSDASGAQTLSPSAEPESHGPASSSPASAPTTSP